MARRKFPVLPVMAVLFVALAAWVFLREIPADRREAAGDATPLLAGCQAADIVRIEVADRDSFVLEKGTNGQWAFVRPAPYKVDQAAVNTLLEALSGLTPARTLRAKEPRLAKYGLSEPTGRLLVATAKTNWQIFFGDEIRTSSETAESAMTYLALAGSPAVHLLETFKANQLRKSLGQYRNKRVLAFDIATMKVIEFMYQGSVTTLVRENEVWQVVEGGVKKPADMQKVLGAVGELYEFSVDDFVSDLAEAAAYGIGAGSATASLRLEDAQGVRTLSFGRKERGKVYCALEAVGEIWSVTEARFERLNKKPFEFLPGRTTNAAAPAAGRGKQ